jgi:hypothetical protein
MSVFLAVAYNLTQLVPRRNPQQCNASHVILIIYVVNISMSFDCALLLLIEVNNLHYRPPTTQITNLNQQWTAEDSFI